MMARRIEIFSAGCSFCNDAVEMVKRVAGPSHQIEVHDMLEAGIVARARQYGIERVPGIVIDGVLVNCCTERGPDEATLRDAIHG